MNVGGGMGFGAFGIVFGIVFIFIVIVFIYAISKSIMTATNNKNSPRLTVAAKVVSKRDQVRGENSYTNYFATFEFENSDRLELEVKGQESGMLVEGDKGQLTFQGSKYVSFVRG